MRLFVQIDISFRCFFVKFYLIQPLIFAGLQLVSQICNGQLNGDSLDSTEIIFTPGEIISGNYLGDAKTAG